MVPAQLNESTSDEAARERDHAWLKGGGELGDLIRRLDWSKTPIGALETWSPALRNTVRLILVSRFPHLLWWGPDYICIYNDAYRPILGRKHPWGLGKPMRECWSEVWDVLKPLIDKPFAGGPATWVDDIELEIHRSGFTEESHFMFAYSPVPDETAAGEIGGVLATVIEITDKIVGERRLNILKDLGTYASDATTAEEACRKVAGVLERYPRDIPFALLYVADSSSGRARLAASGGIDCDEDFAFAEIDLESVDTEPQVWPLAQARATEQMQLVEDLPRLFRHPPRGPWTDPPLKAAVLPIRSGVAHQFPGFLVAGLSSRLKVDQAYKSFLELVTSQIGTTLATAQAYEEERRRADALAAIDRAKTQFFSNVSHEFRTPLTLMLGPLQRVLNGEPNLAPEHREQITIAHRNSLRLLKLVNSLLDFSRIEAGRARAFYAPLDLAQLTEDLASNFRSALETAGLEFVVDCPPLPQPVYADAEMWEKIVLNLLSNAFKFTFEGRITVRMRADKDQAILTVADTGTGIPQAELPRIFERFHRVEDARGRTHEGTGIGLALIRELVTLHGGSITVESRLNEGSTFTVAVPFGHAHLPPEHISSTTPEARSTFRQEIIEQEAAAWLAHPSEQMPALPAAPTRSRPRVLLADDNADMRGYISRVLEAAYEVTPVGDGAAALEQARRNRPDIVLADIMMPNLDGFGMLRELRADPELREVPVILISARAGEEARTEGIAAGADDYLTKPFSVNELVARVETSLSLQRVRRESAEEVARSEERFRAFVTATSDVIYRMNADWSEMRFLRGNNFVADLENTSTTWFEKYILSEDQPHVLETIHTAIRNKQPFELEHRLIRVDGSLGWTFSRAIPLFDKNGEIVEWFGAARDVTARREAEVQLREAADRLRFMAESMPQKIFTASPDGEIDYLNRQWTEFTGAPESLLRSLGWTKYIHSDDSEGSASAWKHSLESGQPFQYIHRFRRADGEYRWHLSRALPMRNANGSITMWIGSTTEIHDQKRAEEELRTANQDLEQFAYSVSHDLQEPLRGIKIFSELLGRYQQNLDDEALSFLENVRLSATRLEALLRDLLTYTQVGRPSKNPETCDANEALNKALVNLQPAMTDSGASVESRSLPPVVMNMTHLQQIFQNLIGNALKYRRPEVAPQILISAEPVQDGWCFAVADNGIGIEPQYRETIFGLFKRLHTGDEYAGTGLGLAICSKILERYHGRIWVESEPGAGSTFYFSIPDSARRFEPSADSVG